MTWDVANTDLPPVSTANVKISLSVDGGHTYPLVLAASTPNDGTESVIVPNVATTQARVKIEAVGNIFFDVSNADFTVTLPGVIGLDSVSISGKGVVDSFDSSLGPYGPGNTSALASLFSNGVIGLGTASVYGDVRSATASVTLEKNGLVTGDVRAGTAINNKGTINGTATPNSPSPPIIAPPVAGVLAVQRHGRAEREVHLRRRQGRSHRERWQDGHPRGGQLLLPQPHPVRRIGIDRRRSGDADAHRAS